MESIATTHWGIEDTLKKLTRTIEKSVVSNFSLHEVAIKSFSPKSSATKMGLYKYVDEYIRDTTTILPTDLGQTYESAHEQTVRA